MKTWSFPIHYILYNFVPIQKPVLSSRCFALVSSPFNSVRVIIRFAFYPVNIQIAIKKMKISSTSKTFDMSDL